MDLEDSYYDHACLDPGSVDADALSPDKSDYMGKKTSCVLPLFCIWRDMFLPSDLPADLSHPFIVHADS